MPRTQDARAASVSETANTVGCWWRMVVFVVKLPESDVQEVNVQEVKQKWQVSTAVVLLVQLLSFVNACVDFC